MAIANPPIASADCPTRSTDRPLEARNDPPQDEPHTAEWVVDSLATGVIFALVLTVGQRVIGFVRGILFCRFMTDQELGQWSMVWSFLMLLAPLATLGLPGCFGKYSEYYRQRGQLNSFVLRIAAISLTLSAAVSLAIILFPATFAELFFRDATQVGLARSLGVGLIAVAASNFVISLMESLRQVRAVTIMRFVTGLAFAVLGTVLLMFWHDNSAAVTLAYAVCCLLGMIPAIGLIRQFRRRDNQIVSTALSHRSMWSRIAPFAFWLWISNLLHNLFEVTDRYMLLHWSDVPSPVAQAMVGQYHSGRVIPLLLVSVAAMMAGVLLPYMSAAWEEGRHDEANRQLNWSYKLVGLSFTAGGVFVMLIAPYFFHTVLQGRYNDGLLVLPMTLVYCIWFSLYTIGQDYLWVAEKGRLATMAVGAGLLANVVLNLLLIPSLGLSGAVIATSAGNFLVVLLILALNHCHGCPTDAGIWISSVVPLVLLFSPWWAGVILVIVAVVGIRTRWILSESEKLQAQVAWLGYREKMLAMVGRYDRLDQF